jgi:hypothetical protein
MVTLATYGIPDYHSQYPVRPMVVTTIWALLGTATELLRAPYPGQLVW